LATGAAVAITSSLPLSLSHANPGCDGLGFQVLGLRVLGARGKKETGAREGNKEKMRWGTRLSNSPPPLFISFFFFIICFILASK